MNFLTACLMFTITANIASSKSLLPAVRPMVRQRNAFRSKGRDHRWIQHGELPQTTLYKIGGADSENRRSLRHLKYYNLDEESPIFLNPKKRYPPLQQSDRNINKRVYKKEKRLESDTKYDNLFDENGMLFLTQPIDLDDRKLNKLMNKVVEYSMLSKKNNFLRKPLTKVFKPEEIRELKNIVRELDEEPEDVRTEFEFSELVQ